MKKQNRKILLIILLAALLAVAGGFAIYQYLMPQKTTIYVFKDNYKAGQEISDDILLPMQVDAKIVIAGKQGRTSDQFVTGANRSELIDKKTNALRMDVAKGMPLTQAMLSIDGGSYIEMTMDTQKVAVSIPISSISGVTSDLKEGSRVNIYASNYAGTSGTTLIFENMRILSVSKDDNGDLKSATVEVSIDESLKLINAANSSSLYFGLVNGSSYQTTGKDDLTYNPANDSEFTGGNEAAEPTPKVDRSVLDEEREDEGDLSKGQLIDDNADTDEIVVTQENAG